MNENFGASIEHALRQAMLHVGLGFIGLAALVLVVVYLGARS